MFINTEHPTCDVLGCPLSTRKMGVGIIGFHSWLLACGQAA